MMKTNDPVEYQGYKIEKNEDSEDWQIAQFKRVFAFPIKFRNVQEAKDYIDDLIVFQESDN